ncbi:MAG: isoprenylcysteine carboxylmethyltransferase family protein [Vicinamibacterales bacterium]
MMASVLPLLFVIATIVTLAATGNLFTAAPAVILAQAVAVGVLVWARRSFAAGTFRVTAGPGGDAIISSGPYRFIRHPMYAAALLFVWSGVLSHPAALTLLLGAAATAIALVRVRAEEKLLDARYPDYPEYRRATKALVPYLY